MPQLKDMALTDAERMDGCMPCVPGEMNRYPYGLCLSLGQPELNKLDADAASLEVGDMVHLFALAKVTAKSINDTGDGEKNRVELQVCYLGTELEDAEDVVSKTAETRSSRLYHTGR